MKIEVTLDEKTWAQLCLLANGGETVMPPERLARLFLTQDVVSFTWARAQKEAVVLADDSLEEDELERKNAEVGRRMAQS